VEVEPFAGVSESFDYRAASGSSLETTISKYLGCRHLCLGAIYFPGSTTANDSINFFTSPGSSMLAAKAVITANE